MRRFRILCSLLVLVCACSSGGSSPPGPFPTSMPTFAVAGPDPTRGTLRSPLEPGLVVASRRGPFRVFASPGSFGSVRPYSAKNDWGQPLWLPTIGDRDVAGHLWLHVLLPNRPNGSTGWLRARDVDTSTVQDR